MIPIRDTIPATRRPYVTYGLIAVNTLVFLYELSLSPHQQEALLFLRGLVPARYTHPEWAAAHGFPPDYHLSFLTSQFLHGGWMHLIGNMWFLHIFGDNVEDRLGHARFLCFYLACGVIAALAQALVVADATVPVVGASGAIAGVLGAYFMLYPRARVVAMIPIVIIPFFFQVPAYLYLLLWFAMQLWSGTSGGAGAEGVAWWAHVAGFAAGALLQRVLRLKETGAIPGSPGS